MVIDFANNVTMLASVDVGPATITTDPVPVMDARTFVQIISNAHSIFGIGATASLAVQLEGSNDGQTFVPQTAIADITATVEGAQETSGPAPYSYVRLKFVLTPTGAATEWVTCTFDVHANFSER